MSGQGQSPHGRGHHRRSSKNYSQRPDDRYGGESSAESVPFRSPRDQLMKHVNPDITAYHKSVGHDMRSDFVDTSFYTASRRIYLSPNVIPTQPEKGEDRNRSNGNRPLKTNSEDLYLCEVRPSRDPYVEHDPHLRAIDREQSGHTLLCSGLESLGWDSPAPYQSVSRSPRYKL